MKIPNFFNSKIFSNLVNILSSLLLISIGIIFIFEANIGLPFLIILLIILMVIMIILNIISFIIKRNNLKNVLLLNLANMIVLIILIFYPRIFIRFTGLIVGGYILINGIIYFVDYSLARQDHLNGILHKFIISLIYMIAGILLIFLPLKSSFIIFVLSGIYIIVAGSVRFIENLLVIFNQRFNVTLALPVFLGALIPPRLYMSINNNPKLKDNFIDDPKDNKKAPLEVFIYLRDGFFESLGHVDISYDGTIYSYGLHDPERRRLFGSAGDGVLIKAERDVFLKNCLKSGKTIILDFKLYPSDNDMVLIKKRIDELMVNSKPFICKSHEEKLEGKEMLAQDYISDVYRDTECELYKFKKGRFKTYFVFTTNCVGLADYLIRNKEVDILNINGIVTPGNYLNFLYRLYEKDDSIVKDLVVMKKTIE